MSVSGSVCRYKGIANIGLKIQAIPLPPLLTLEDDWTDRFRASVAQYFSPSAAMPENGPRRTRTLITAIWVLSLWFYAIPRRYSALPSLTAVSLDSLG
jgi:hypothetical protein